MIKKYTVKSPKLLKSHRNYGMWRANKEAWALIKTK